MDNQKQSIKAPDNNISPEADKIARAICREQCAFYGEPPCWQVGEWPGAGCEDPGCVALAMAAKAAMEPKL